MSKNFTLSPIRCGSEVERAPLGSFFLVEIGTKTKKNKVYNTAKTAKDDTGQTQLYYADGNMIGDWHKLYLLPQ